jgi:rare lipoprotein A
MDRRREWSVSGRPASRPRLQEGAALSIRDTDDLSRLGPKAHVEPIVYHNHADGFPAPLVEVNVITLQSGTNFQRMRVSRTRGRIGLCGRLMALVAGGLLLANCSGTSRIDPKWGVAASPRVVDDGQPVPKGGGRYRVGKPYTIGGKTYVPEEDVNYKAEGFASWYGDDFHGRFTANGEVFDMNSITAAHPTMPLPSYARVTNLRNKKSLVVRVNDRGPYVGNRVIDLSARVAKLLEFQGHGVTKVRVEYVGRAPLAGSDDRKLMATLRDGNAPPPKVQLASSKDFAPYFDPKPMNEASNAPRKPVAQQVASAADDDEADADAPARIASADLPAPMRSAPVQTASREAAPAVSQVSAYAPPRYDGRAGFLNGRGLY